jgi:hypothetical protein
MSNSRSVLTISVNDVPLCMGLASDLEHPRLRMVCLLPDRDYPTVWDHRSFASLRGFQRYVREWFCLGHEYGVGFRVLACRLDPLGAIPWLRSQGIPVTEAALDERHDLEQEFLMRELPARYRRPFALAFHEVYRFQEPQTLQQLWLQLLRLRQELGAVARELGHLAQAHTCEETPF